jgi:four helix bundle protein
MNSPATTASYKNLIIYQKAKSLAKDVLLYFSNKKVPYTKKFIIGQLFRSISSIGANIAESYGRHYKGSLRQFYGIARGSSFESDYWLDLLLDLEIFETRTIKSFIERNTELSKMLTVLMKNTE